MLNPESTLLISISQKANSLGPQFSVTQYLDDYELELDRTGLLLRFLGLAEESDKSDLGWAPTGRLMRFVADRWGHPHEDGHTITVSEDDRDFVEFIYHLATGDVVDDACVDPIAEFCFNFLATLGLLKKGENGFKPTPRLQYLVLERCLNVPAKEKKE
jgi:hypothetical protein